MPDGRPPWVSPTAVFRAPPSWPRPPVGWVPPPYWLPPYHWVPAPAGWRFWDEGPAPLGEASFGRRGWALDRSVREARARAGAVWGWRVAIWPIVALAAVMVLGSLIVGLLPLGDGALAGGVGTILFYVVLVGAGFLVGRPIAQLCGGWSAAFGWGRARWLDLPIGAAGASVQFLARIVVALILIALVPALRNADASNLDVDGLSWTELLLTAVVAVIVAPVVEEFLFRGLILRTLMTRMPFWPAAVASSAVFALFHAPAVDTVAGAALLVSSILVFSIGQCLIVRWQARLAPAIVSHAIANAAAILIAVAVGR